MNPLITMSLFRRITRNCFLVAVAGFLLVWPGGHPMAFAQTNSTNAAPTDTQSTGLIARVAPGETLPVAVKLSNFGGGQRVDVLVRYELVAGSGRVISSTSETVAVETTANFVKTIAVPVATAPGTYTAKTFITYPGQLVPAISQFTFTVERKIFGLWTSDFYLYGGATLILGGMMLALGHVLIKRSRATRWATLDYSDVPHETRTFYEIISDTIMEMRERVGDDALLIAENVDGLTVDTNTGRVLALTARPSKIIATLVYEYERVLGKKVSFSFRSGRPKA